MKFSCPQCGEPWAQTEEREADIHCGTVHHCDDCKGEVVLEAFTPEEYRRICDARRELYLRAGRMNVRERINFEYQGLIYAGIAPRIAMFSAVERVVEAGIIDRYRAAWILGKWKHRRGANESNGIRGE